MKRLFSVLFSMKGLVGAALGFITLLAPTLALADELNSGDTAWMITATVLVLMMTIPGLSLFYAGMVRSKNVLSVMMQCFAITCLVTVIWVVYGYSMPFDTTGMEAVVAEELTAINWLKLRFGGEVCTAQIDLDQLREHATALPPPPSVKDISK